MSLHSSEHSAHGGCAFCVNAAFPWRTKGTQTCLRTQNSILRVITRTERKGPVMKIVRQDQKGKKSKHSVFPPPPAFPGLLLK